MLHAMVELTTAVPTVDLVAAAAAAAAVLAAAAELGIPWMPETLVLEVHTAVAVVAVPTGLMAPRRERTAAPSPQHVAGWCLDLRLQGRHH